MAPKLVGTLHFYTSALRILCGWGLLGGVWSATIADIDDLVPGPLWNQTSITIRGGKLSGQIPPELGNLTNLTMIDLSYNNLSGPIPAELGGLPKLTNLSLSYNRLSGPIPFSLGDLNSLIILSLAVNNLSGPIPPELGSLPKLTDLSLFSNHLSGPIPPELGRLSNLTSLSLYNNSLSGTIPPELGSLFNLTILYLYSNDLSGPIPPELGSLSNLNNLSLSSNRLSGPIPPELGRLSNLTSLSLLINDLSGTIPPELGRLSNLTSLSLYSNDLSGTIPPELGSLFNLTILYLYSNDLSGPIPPELGRLTRLTRLELYSNNLSGPIPPELGRLSNLTHLWLNSNDLSGPIPPELGSLSNLFIIDLSNNSLSGPIPPELGRLSKLDVLDLSRNGLFGPIPPQLGNLSRLSYLFLSSNALSGHIPPELGRLTTSLSLLHLQSNGLSGTIPPELGRLARLIALVLDNNDLSGPIPSELSRMISLMFLHLSFNDLSGPIPPGLGRLAQLTRLELSSNGLSGPIPPELGRLTRLTRLDLSSNGLSGPIPPELGRLTQLTRLDLSSNELSGPILPEFSSLDGLEFFNLSSTNTSCELLDLSRVRKIRNLGLPCSPPPSFERNNLTYVALSVSNSYPTIHLDLSSVPDSCKVVNLTGPHPGLESIRFWGACDEGCVVSLAGTGGRLARSTRRKVCLSRISVFLSGDIPFPLYDDRGGFLGILHNQRGNYTLADPDFVDMIDLGSDGRAYTGVGFSRVQAGNLCGNPEAKAVTALVFGVFAVLLLMGTVSIVLVARWRRRVRGTGLETVDGGRLGFKRGALYLWGAALGVLPVADVVTDFLVLSEVWGAWPMWVVLASVCVPFVWGSFAVAKAWSSSGSPVRGWKGLRVRLLWPLPALRDEQPRTSDGWSPRAAVLAILLLPLGLLGVLVQDLLSVAERFGLHLATGDRIVVFERYHESRVVVELLLESLPQAVFQTGLYVIGSSRATRIYIDQRIFVQSIVVSLCSLSVHYCSMLWEAVYEGRSLVGVFLDRFRSAGQPSLVPVTSQPSADEEVEGLSGKVAS